MDAPPGEVWKVSLKSKNAHRTIEKEPAVFHTAISR